ncbi:glycosyltransferase family 2 protein [Salinivibrio kushneri]|uniref:glycosyltransferase family 2 protein n=1 Tax=Salinivibrio kushneri TaxID=1908198 RepID=UPI0009894EB6|nr:glycosyltransferase [Salinivibrio kushneri]OOE63844.1 hypothetical protein BZG19_15685 [Salinivibrio kushneri]
MNRVSIVIPAYRAENLILKAVNSALEQGPRVAEVIVVIDGVFDRTRELLDSISDSRLQVIVFSDNKGAQVARNTGLEVAKNKYVTFLDSDDFFEGDIIDSAAQCLDKSTADFCLSPNIILTSDSKENHYEVPNDVDRLKLLEGRLFSTMAVGIQCIMWKKSFLHKIGGWCESMSRNQDGELSIRALVHGGVPTFNSNGAGCSFQHQGYRVSRRRTLNSFTCQETIYDMVSAYLLNHPLTETEKIRIQAALNFFCANICIGMAENGFIGKEFKEWKSRVKWKLEYFFCSPKSKSFQVLLFLAFGTKSYKVKTLLVRMLKFR